MKQKLLRTKCSMKTNCSNIALLQCLNEAETAAYKVQHEDKQLAALHLPVALHYSEQQLAADVLDYTSCEAAKCVVDQQRPEPVTYTAAPVTGTAD